MKALFCFTVLGALAVGAPAWADFQLGPMQSSAPATTENGSRPIVLSPVTPPPVQRRARRVALVPGVPVARGFGRDVPLAFATRQIVPLQVKVTFGPGVDQAVLVDWKGGRPWVETLQAAVRPLGLRVAVSRMTVSIIHS